MKTQRRILLVVGVLVLACAGLVALAEFLLGAMLGSVVVLGAVVIMTAAYFGLVRPWLLRWGATAGEVVRPMPGDGILGADAPATTRAITIGVPAHHVWPWLAQLGYGRAGTATTGSTTTGSQAPGTFTPNGSSYGQATGS
jgi:hypothetical protein